MAAGLTVAAAMAAAAALAVAVATATATATATVGQIHTSIKAAAVCGCVHHTRAEKGCITVVRPIEGRGTSPHPCTGPLA